MKKLCMLCAFLATTALLWGAPGSEGVIYIGHEKVDATFAKGGPTLVNRSDLVVIAAHRTEAGKVEMHEKQTDVFYIVDGSATFVTGGKMIGGKKTEPGQWLGTKIEGGETHHLSKGDVIVIPAGVPHWYKEVPRSVSYFVVKLVKP